MDLALIFTIIGSAVTTVGFVYGFLRNFKVDFENKFNRLESQFNRLESQFDRLKSDTQSQFERLEKKMDKFDEKLTDIDRRLCRMEGAFSSKDCCILKEDKQIRKAE